MYDGSGEASACRRRRHRRRGFHPWVGKILWKRKWQPTPVFFFIYNFICFRASWVFAAAWAWLLVTASGGYSLVTVCVGVSRQGCFLLRATGSRCTGFRSPGARTRSLWLPAPERMPNSCGAQALSLRGRWDPPGPGIEPMSPCAGREILCP